jgi:hypothetical protein
MTAEAREGPDGDPTHLTTVDQTIKRRRFNGNDLKKIIQQG